MFGTYSLHTPCEIVVRYVLYLDTTLAAANMHIDNVDLYDVMWIPPDFSMHIDNVDFFEFNFA